MKLSRYGLIGMTLVIASFVLVLLAVAPKAGSMDTARRLSHLGAALEVYCYKHGRLPPALGALVDDGSIPRDFCDALEREVKYLAAGRQCDGLSGLAIVALQDPANVAGSIPVVVLLADGSVLAVPADVVRGAAARPDEVTLLDSAPDGQLTAVVADAGR